MKKLLFLTVLIVPFLVNAQAYTGKGDVKAQVGAAFQNSATSIRASADFGLGVNISYGFAGSYILNYADGKASDIPFKDRIDLKARFNANLGDVFGLDKKMDIYPGLNLGLKNFGAHVGFRYFFTDGFGVYTEAELPISRYDNENDGFNNQFIFHVGASFNL
jgi:hypothetical protein